MKQKSISSSLPSAVTSNLEALQSHYHGILDAYEEQVNHARNQLAHIEALLNQSTAISALPQSSTSKEEPVATSKSTGKTPRKYAKSALPQQVEQPKASSRRNSTLKFIKPYQDKTMLGAIQQVLQERKGKVVTIDETVQTLYGDLKSDLYKVAKERVMKSLSKGKQEGMWESVPNKLGCYTLAIKSLKG